MTFKLSGWQRIGVILSFGWAIYMVGTAISEHTAQPRFEDVVSSPCPSLSYGSFHRWYDRKTNKELVFQTFGKPMGRPVWYDTPFGKRTFVSLTCGELKNLAAPLAQVAHDGQIDPALEVMYGELFLVSIVPIVLAWFAVYLLVWLIRWVNGFKRT